MKLQHSRVSCMCYLVFMKSNKQILTLSYRVAMYSVSGPSFRLQYAIVCLNKIGLPCTKNRDKCIGLVASTSGFHAVSGLKFCISKIVLTSYVYCVLMMLIRVYLQNLFIHLYRNSDVESMTDGHHYMTAYGHDDGSDKLSMFWARNPHTLRNWVYKSGLFYMWPAVPSTELLDSVAARLSWWKTG